MKLKLFTITCCIILMLTTTNSKAQAPDTSTVDKLIRYILQPIDKSQVPTSILAEYGAPILNLPTFNGTLTDSNTVDITAFRALAFQMQTSYCGTGTSPIPTITTVNNSIASFIHDTLPVPIPIFISSYNSVKADAFTNNLLSYNSSTNQVQDVGGRSQSPYQANYLFAATPVLNLTKTGTAQFVCNGNMLWNNSGKIISQIQIDFDNTLGLNTITIGTPITVSYADTGTKRWTTQQLAWEAAVKAYLNPIVYNTNKYRYTIYKTTKRQVVNS